MCRWRCAETPCGGWAGYLLHGGARLRIERRVALRSARRRVSGRRLGSGFGPDVPPEARVCWLACHARDTETHAYPSEMQSDYSCLINLAVRIL